MELGVIYGIDGRFGAGIFWSSHAEDIFFAKCCHFLLSTPAITENIFALSPGFSFASEDKSQTEVEILVTTRFIFVKGELKIKRTSIEI